MDVVYVSNPDNGFPTEKSWDTYLSGFVNVTGKSADKIKIKSISGEGYIEAPDVTETTGRRYAALVIYSTVVIQKKKIPQIIPPLWGPSMDFLT